MLGIIVIIALVALFVILSISPLFYEKFKEILKIK